MELCDGGDLFDRIRERRQYPEADAAAVVLSLVSVVAACQRMGLIHRDLKPENVLLQHKDCHTSVTVVDFGLAEFVKPGEGGGQSRRDSMCCIACFYVASLATLIRVTRVTSAIFLHPFSRLLPSVFFLLLVLSVSQPASQSASQSAGPSADS